MRISPLDTPNQIPTESEVVSPYVLATSEHYSQTKEYNGTG